VSQVALISGAATDATIGSEALWDWTLQMDPLQMSVRAHEDLLTPGELRVTVPVEEIVQEDMIC
jgi:hypothetical protein